MIVGILIAAAVAASPAPAKRCGWLVNPTPGNWWLIDRAGEWTLGMQGNYQAPGMDDMPDMSAKDWVETNGSYGHGCACMTVSTDPRARIITRLYKAAPMPLETCNADRRLPRP